MQGVGASDVIEVDESENEEVMQHSRVENGRLGWNQGPDVIVVDSSEDEEGTLSPTCLLCGSAAHLLLDAHTSKRRKRLPHHSSIQSPTPCETHLQSWELTVYIWSPVCVLLPAHSC